MPALQLRSKEVLRIRREDLVPLGNVISKSPISVGRLLMDAWECVEGVGFGVCRCEFAWPSGCIARAFCYRFCPLQDVTTEKRGVVGNLDDTIDVSMIPDQQLPIRFLHIKNDPITRER
jgi:hypothetical protein